MNIYELITPSDPITFKADDDKIAFLCAVHLGNGQAGCRRTGENGNQIDIPSLMLFNPDPQKTADEHLGCSTDEFVELNKDKISACYLSFAYGSIEDRKTFDDALESITDKDKLDEFKVKHEDRNRSSMSRWVDLAWKYGKALKKD